MSTRSVPSKSRAVSQVVSMDMISKNFPGVKALDRGKLDLYPGQVTALVSENGAGKSTTVKILSASTAPMAAPSALTAYRSP